MRKFKLGKKVVSICVGTMLAGIIMCNSSYAESSVKSEFEVEYSKSYIEWANSEDRTVSNMPFASSNVMPEGYLESQEASINQIGTLLNDSILKLDTVKGYAEGSTYNVMDHIPVRVKNQMNTAECWAFSLLTCFENNTYLYENIETNYSERHMDYATVKRFRDGINPKGYNRSPAEGGVSLIGLAYLTNGTGAVSENKMPFENNTSQINLSDIDIPAEREATGYLILPQILKEFDSNGVRYYDAAGNEYTQDGLNSARRYIKECVVKYGGVVTTTAANELKYYSDPSDATGSGAYFCNNPSIRRDHAITIIGWDDNYSRNNFNSTYRPSTDGAYICLNSYGTGVQNSGTYYISYEDVLVESDTYAIESTKMIDYDNIYQSDFCGGAFKITAPDTRVGYYGLKYTKNGSEKETITHVGVSLQDYVSFEVYINPSNDNLNTDTLTFVGSSNGVLAPGYHKIDINDIEISGNSFGVVIKQTSTNNKFTVAVESSYAGSMFSDVRSSRNSYMSFDGRNWSLLNDEDISGIDTENSDFCVKVFTKTGGSNPDIPVDPDPDIPIVPDPDDPINPDPDIPIEPDPDIPIEPDPDIPIEPDPDIPIVPDPDDPIEMEYFRVNNYVQDDSKMLIRKIERNTKIADFIKNIDTNINFSLKNKDNRVIIENDYVNYVSTGMKIVLDNGDVYTLIVRGDLNCDGVITLTDFSKMILEYNEVSGYRLSGAPLEAADLNIDNKITLTDVSQLVVIYSSIGE